MKHRCRLVVGLLRRAVPSVGSGLLLAAPWAPAAVPLPVIPGQVFNITNYGAIGDNVATNTTAIQNTINAAGAAGGGIVEVPAGTYLSGPLTLKNSVNLQLNAGATLKMLPYGSYPGGASPTDFISGTRLHDIAITGSGTIEGQGAAWWAAYQADNTLARPKAMFAPSGCTNILVQDLTLQNPPNTHISFRASSGNACRNVTVQRIRINTPYPSPNTDGIDLNAANCLIQDNSIACGDDNIAVSSSSTGVSAQLKDILITNCAFGTGHGMSIGSYTQAGVSNMTVINCTFTNTISGIRIKSARDRGGIMQALTYANLTLANVQNPIFLSGYYPDSTIPIDPSTSAVQVVTGTTPIYRNITITNVSIVAATGRNAGRIYGLPEMSISNVVLAGVTIAADKTFQVYNAQGIRFADSSVALPPGIPTFTLYRAQLAITNTALRTNLVTLEVPTANAAGNNFLVHNARVSLRNTNVLGSSPSLVLGGCLLTVSNHLNLLPAAALGFQPGTNGTTLAVVSNLAVRGTIDIAAGPGFTHTNYTLFTYGQALAWGPPLLGSTPPGYVCALDTNTPGQVRLNVQLPPPDAPTNLSASAAISRVDLNWSPVGGATGYAVKRSTAAGGPYAVVTSNLLSTAYADDSVLNGVTYFYVVSAANAGGESADSAEASARPEASLAPVNLDCQPGGGQLRLSWDAAHQGWRLEIQTNAAAAGLGSGWVTVRDSRETNQAFIPVDTAQGSVFLRLAYP